MNRHGDRILQVCCPQPHLSFRVVNLVFYTAPRNGISAMGAYSGAGVGRSENINELYSNSNETRGPIEMTDGSENQLHLSAGDVSESTIKPGSGQSTHTYPASRIAVKEGTIEKVSEDLTHRLDSAHVGVSNSKSSTNALTQTVDGEVVESEAAEPGVVNTKSENRVTPNTSTSSDANANDLRTLSTLTASGTVSEGSITDLTTTFDALTIVEGARRADNFADDDAVDEDMRVSGQSITSSFSGSTLVASPTHNDDGDGGRASEGSDGVSTISEEEEMRRRSLNIPALHAQLVSVRLILTLRLILTPSKDVNVEA